MNRVNILRQERCYFIVSRTAHVALILLLISFLFALGFPSAYASQSSLTHALSNGSPIRTHPQIMQPQWTPLGPQPIQRPSGYASGRITAIAVDGYDGDIWIGAADGGVWFSSNGGTTWKPMTDTQPTLSIGSIAIDRVSPSAIYVGTGEGNLNGGGYGGMGILKSVDNGTTWTRLAPEFTNLGIPKIAIDPNNHLNLLAAVDPIDPLNRTAHKSPDAALFNMGIWHSTDGGQTWTQVESDAPGGPVCDGGTDVLFDPTNPGVALAGMSNVLQCKSGSHAGVYVSKDYGATWKLVKSGIPSGRAIYRVSLGIAAIGTGLNAYAAFTDGGSSVGGKTRGSLLNGSMYVSTNSGTNWRGKKVSPDMASDSTFHQWDYNSVVAVDPTNEQIAYAGGIHLWQTTDGGTTWNNNVTQGKNVHEDQHALTFLSGSTSQFYLGNDGGVWSGHQIGSFTNLNGNDPQGNNLNITQFYSGSIGEQGSYAQLYGGAQDNGELQFPSGSSPDHSAVWNQVDTCCTGDGTAAIVDWKNNAIVYDEHFLSVGTNYFHLPAKSTNGGKTWNDINNGIDYTNPQAFAPPLVMSATRTDDLVFGTDRIYHTTNSGNTWGAISTSLEGGQPITSMAVAPPKLYVSYIYAGFNDGNVWVTTDGGGHWHHSSSPPRPIMVSGLAVDPTNPNIAYATYPTYSTFGGEHVYRTTDAGMTWTDISLSMPNIPAESVLVTPTPSGLVFVGTDAGIFSTSNNGSTWDNVGSGLPNVVIDQIFTNHQSTNLFVATHGRGMWLLPLFPPPGTITEYPIPTSGSTSEGITAGPDGNLWFTEYGGDKIGKITPGGTITEYSIPTRPGTPEDITSGPDSNLWFTEFFGNNIGKITPGGTITEYPTPTSNTSHIGITAGPDGNLWFTETGPPGKIGKITPGGTITEYPIPTSNSWPFGITSGPDGNLWFTEHNGNKIGKITPGGTVTEYSILINSAPDGITSGPDGNLWFTEHGGNKIGKITLGGTVTEYPTPTSNSTPEGITSGPDGNLWFTEYDGNKIGKITPGGTITEYPIPTNASSPYGITAGPDGNLWFTEYNGNKIGKITPK